MATNIIHPLFLRYYLDVLEAVQKVQKREVYADEVYIDTITFGYGGYSVGEARLVQGESGDLELEIGDGD